MSEAGTISTEVAARLIMATPQWVRRLTLQGWIKKQGKDQYRITDVVQGYITFLKDESRKLSQSAAGAKVLEARAEEIRLRNAQRHRTMIREGQEAAIAAIDEIAGPLKSDLLAIPARLTKDLALRRNLEDAIEGALGAMSKRCFKLAEQEGMKIAAQAERPRAKRAAAPKR